MTVGPNLLVGEEMRRDLLDSAPEVAVGGEGDTDGAVEDDVSHGGVGPRREHLIVRAQDGLCGARGGNDERGDGAKVEEHEAIAAVLDGEAAEGDVGEGPYEV